MRYLLLIALDESASSRTPEEDGQEMLPEYAAFMKDMAERGVLLGGERLRLTSDATTVRVRNGETLTTRRAVCRDQGAAGRLLPRRLQEP